MSSSYHLIFAPILTVGEQLQAFEVNLEMGAHRASVAHLSFEFAETSGFELEV